MPMTKKPETAESLPASEQIDRKIAELGDWRGKTLARMRKLIHEAGDGVEETWKWMGTPVFERDGIVCTGETYKDKVKLTFAKGASLPDPKGLFNSSLEGNARRAIDIGEGETVDATAFKALIRAAIELNRSKVKTKAAVKSPTKTATKTATTTAAKSAAAQSAKKTQPAVKKTAK